MKLKNIIGLKCRKFKGVFFNTDNNNIKFWLFINIDNGDIIQYIEIEIINK